MDATPSVMDATPSVMDATPSVMDECQSMIDECQSMMDECHAIMHATSTRSKGQLASCAASPTKRSRSISVAEIASADGMLRRAG